MVVFFTAHQGVNGINWDFVSFEVRTGANLRSPDAIFTSNADVIYYPSHVGLFDGYDLALLKMNTPVTGITPAKLYTGTVNIGDTVNFAGYGAFGVQGGPEPVYDYNKRGYQSVVNNFGPYYAPQNFLNIQFDGPGIANYLPLGGTLWQGDSGGGWFVEDEGEWKLAGISSFGLLHNNSYGTQSGATTIDINWVNSIVGSSAASPEPGSLVVLSLGFGIFALKKWKKRSAR